MKFAILICLALVLFSSHAGAQGCGWPLPTPNTTFTQNYTCNGTAFNLADEGTILDCAGYTIAGNGSSYGINISGNNQITVKNCIIQNFERGISIINSDNNTLINNSVSNNTYGIVIQRSNINTLTNNTVTNNQWHGLYVDNKSLGNTLENNQFCNNNQAGGGYYDFYNRAPTLDVREDPKIWEHLGYDLAPYNASTMSAGGIVFDLYFNYSNINENRVFTEFGIVRGAPGSFPTTEFIFYFNSDATIYSPYNATVWAVNYNSHTSDYGISMWVTGYEEVYGVGVDHVHNVTVSVNDTVLAGDVLGTPGSLAAFDDGPHNAYHDGKYWGLVEFPIQLNNFDLCPTRFFTDSLLASFNESIMQLISEWETFIGDENVHNESAFVLPGCLYDEYPSIKNLSSNTGDNNTCSSVLNYNDTDVSGCEDTCAGVTTTTSTSTTTTTSTTSTSTTSTTSTSTTSTTTTSIPVTHYVNISGNQFVPANITINVTDIVNWTNLDSSVHRIRDNNSAVFDSGDLSQNEFYSFQFNSSGLIDYYCVIHPSMTGTVNVTVSTAQIPLLIGWNLISIPLVV